MVCFGSRWSTGYVNILNWWLIFRAGLLAQSTPLRIQVGIVYNTRLHKHKPEAADEALAMGLWDLKLAGLPSVRYTLSYFPKPRVT